MAWFEPQITLEQDEGEELLYTVRRHWILLLRNAFFPVMLGLGAALLALYRAVGGSFFVGSAESIGQFDILNGLFLIIILVLGVFWLRRDRKKSKLGLPYIIGISFFAIIMIFRFAGGRVFYIDPLNSSGGDPLNLLLITVAIVMAAMVVYLVIDWQEDFLVLTTTRVVYDQEQFLVRHTQQQILIDDIQQVNVSASGYLEYWLGYGTIVVQSFSPRRLEFRYAAKPKEMQQRVLGELNNLRKQQQPELLRQMIEDQVYDNKAPPPPAITIQVEEKRSPFLQWLFPPNPQIDYQRETIIWRPSWVYLGILMLRPFGILMVTTLAIVLVGVLGWIPAGWSLLLWLPVAIITGFWIFWIREDYIHDVYILTRKDFTDVDKRPFGPESRRRAPLGAIQDMTSDVGFVENILGYGDVNIVTGGSGGTFTFNHVPNPRGVQATINDYLTDFRKHEKEGQLRETIALLREYHTVQSDHGEVFDREDFVATVAERVAAESKQPEVQEQITRDLAAQLQARVRREARVAARTEIWRTLRGRGRRRSQ
ncbi:MAG: PH domain-containing protein [Chloroflexi bacterium AL-W]|nr:PH domain-containing protein [Chloroflexi bacterium AL-N1]NOK66260.1 PH domain-containing protein [Chloroflexi bacterium AL-N10]NOK73140.1 PH domain-containing protein [Chloroflexi bacterium AL-N5]NOK80037.1 PH domain-containing protein [Chloroflexi bacterium AL-W]NOK88107.1 PH domain-containing protein [Chloroflexi bacterium AL-N15]